MFSECDGYCHGSRACFRAHTLPLGMLYDPNMVEEQNE